MKIKIGIEEYEVKKIDTVYNISSETTILSIFMPQNSQNDKILDLEGMYADIFINNSLTYENLYLLNIYWDNEKNKYCIIGKEKETNA